MAIRLTGMISGMDTESLIRDMVDAQRLKNKRLEDKQTLLTWKQEKWKDLNTKIYKLYTDSLSKMRLQSSYRTNKATSTDENLVSVSANATTPVGTHTLVVNNLAKSQFVTSAKINTDADGNPITAKASTKLVNLGITEGTKIRIGSKTLTVSEDTTIQKFVDKAKDAGLTASFDAAQGRLFISSQKSGAANSFGISAVDESGEDAGELLNKLGLDALNTDGTKVDEGSTLSTVVAASDSSVLYNGVNITSSSNVIEVNGLSITLKGADQNKTISINVVRDNAAIYDMVKNFVKAYNETLKEMNTLYHAASAKGYDPLSDDEREAMTDDQIEKWETKIKDAILRRDPTIGALTDSMRNIMMSSVEVNGKRYALSSFGIETSTDYTERGLLHIKGDPDDPIYGSGDNKLKDALSKDPDTVIEVLTNITKKLYDDMYNRMKSIPNVRSALTFYDDKLMIEQQRTYAKQIKAQESKLTEIENKYYKQFSEMESAMAKMQAQSNNLAAMLGQNSR